MLPRAAGAAGCGRKWTGGTPAPLFSAAALRARASRPPTSAAGTSVYSSRPQAARTTRQLVGDRDCVGRDDDGGLSRPLHIPWLGFELLSVDLAPSVPLRQGLQRSTGGPGLALFWKPPEVEDDRDDRHTLRTRASSAI